jgi:hypothetical protein
MWQCRIHVCNSTFVDTQNAFVQTSVLIFSTYFSPMFLALRSKSSYSFFCAPSPPKTRLFMDGVVRLVDDNESLDKFGGFVSKPQPQYMRWLHHWSSIMHVNLREAVWLLEELGCAYLIRVKMNFSQAVVSSFLFELLFAII